MIAFLKGCYGVLFTAQIKQNYLRMKPKSTIIVPYLFIISTAVEQKLFY